MPKKLPRKKSKAMGRKQMKKTPGGFGDGSVRFIVDTIGPAPGKVKVDPSNPNLGGVWDPGN